MRLFLLLPLLFSFTACHSINSVSLTQIPPQRNKEVKAEVSRFIFLGLNFDNDYVDPLVEKLKSQCEGGMIRGILTKDETVDYFLMLLYTRRVTASGYCVNGGKKVGMLEREL